MEKLPLIVLSPPKSDARLKGSPRFFKIETPSAQRQRERIGPKFKVLQRFLQTDEDTAKLSDNSGGVHPERALVFELAQSKQSFKRAVEKLGLNWIDESDFLYEQDSDFFDPRKKGKPLEGRLYLTVPNVRAIAELLKIWDKYSAGEPLPGGYKEWSDLFGHLKDIRPWGAKDRLSPEASNFIAALEGSVSDTVNLELELLFFDDVAQDSVVDVKLQSELERLSVSVLDHARIPEIRYHALLISMTEASAKKLLSLDADILNIDEVLHVRPQAMSMKVHASEPGEEINYGFESDAELLPPVAALFDGVAVPNHQLLKGRLLVSDPDGLEELAPVKSRHHGTAMASLILHGDLANEDDTLLRRLYVHYVMGASAKSTVETTPPNKLLLNVIHSAVKRLKESPPELGGDVFVINLSLGDINRPFVGGVSAWARLIDFLSWKYNLLFIVSAGNISAPLSLGDIQTPIQIASLSKEQKMVSFIKSVEAGMSRRGIFSPAESVNALTVGAEHSDGCESKSTAYLVDPVSESGFPSLISALGLGYKQSVKPEILHAGGRAMYSYSQSKDGLIFQPGVAGRYFGQQVAGVGSDSEVVRIIGTSNSAALTTRAAIIVHDELKEQLTNSEFSGLKPFMPSIVKAFLVHSASWGRAGELLEELLQPRNSKLWKNRRSNITRFLGYGAMQLHRVLGCTERRVTMIGTGVLNKEEAELFSFPLPSSLSGRKDVRRLVITLAWISPTSPGEMYYKDALLDFRAENEEGFPIGVHRVRANQPPSDTSRRGTVVHEIYEGADAVPVGDDEMLRIRVECRTQGSYPLPPIKYGLIVTFEVAESIKTNIYSEIRDKISVGRVHAPRVRG